MSSSSPLFVIWGYGSENVFREFASFLRGGGHDVLTLPHSELPREAELERLTREPFILLTSSHFTRGKQILHEYYPDIAIQNEFLELLHHCRPLLSVFYPHDLSTPLVVNEAVQLGSFDLVLWPTRFFGYQPYPRKLVTTGWIGFSSDYRPPAFRSHNSVFLFSDICMHRSSLGVAGTFDKLAPILECGTAIKFPYWPGHEEFESYFSERGAMVIPAETKAGDLILDSRVIVSNSVSSISVEASLMGTPVINLIEDYLPKGTQREFISGMRGCVLSRYADIARHLANPPSPPPVRVNRFDSAQVLEVILAEAALKHGTADLKGLPPLRNPSCRVKLSCSGREDSSRAADLWPRQGAKTVEEHQTLDQKSCEISNPGAANPRPIVPPGKMDSNADTVRLATAVRLLERGDIESAFSIFQDLANEGTTLSGPYYHLALIAEDQGEDDIALEFLRVAVQHERPPGDAHRCLATMCLVKSRHQEALEVLSPMLRQAPRDHDALELLRITLGQMPALDPISWARLIGDLSVRSA